MYNKLNIPIYIVNDINEFDKDDLLNFDDIKNTIYIYNNQYDKKYKYKNRLNIKFFKVRFINAKSYCISLRKLYNNVQKK